MRVSGGIIVDGRQVGDTLQCCHCNMHWEVVKGSGRRRGYCMSCGRPTCGKPSCDPCVPFEKKLEWTERSAGRIPLL